MTSSAFVVDVAENWQSEFLQFFLFILATVWLIQIGSSESKQPGDEGTGTDKDQLVGRPRPSRISQVGEGGWVASRALLHLAAHHDGPRCSCCPGWSLDRRDAWCSTTSRPRTARPRSTGSATSASADFWNRTLQNWQSEFLAVGSMVAFSIYLRQRGLPSRSRSGCRTIRPRSRANSVDRHPDRGVHGGGHDRLGRTVEMLFVTSTRPSNADAM